MPTHAALQSAETQPVSHRIAFIDTSIHDYRSIIDGIEAGIDVVLIDGQADGVAQIAAALAGRSGIEAVHIFSHGSQGQVNLGSAHLNLDSIGAHAGNLATIGAALAENADILLYGCDVGAGTRGIALLDALALATGADIAASADLTGNAALGGNWVLERSRGAIEAGAPFGENGSAFGGVLESVNFAPNEYDYYTQQNITKQVGGVAFTFGVSDPGMVIGYDRNGLYAYVTGDDDVELVISAPSGYSFDLGSMQIQGDTPDAADENRDITIVITRVDGSTTSFTTTLTKDNELVTVGNFSTAINDVTKVAFSSNHYAVFNNFEITDVKLIGPADATAPVITAVSIPNQPMKIGSIVTATITVAADGDTYTLGAGSTVGGYALGNLAKVNDTTWTATFTVTAGSPDVAAGADIPVSLVLRDSAGNASTAYTAPIVQANDAIDANRPAPATLQLTAADDSGWSNSDGVTRVVQPTLAGTAEANSTVTLNIDGADVATGIAVDASGKWSATLAAPLAQGPHSVKALATDAAGNAGDYGSAMTIRVDTVAPTSTVTLAAFSADTGSSSNDLVTNQPSQTVAGLLSAGLAADERVLVSLDNGAHWQQAITTTGSSSWVLSGQTLVSSNTMQVKVVDQAGNDGPVATFAYVLDTLAPTATVGAVALSADTGVSNTDLITRIATQTVSATLSAPLAAGEILYASTDGGATWTDISARVSGTAVSWATTLRPGSNGLAFQVMDQAGNAGAATTRAYTLDTTAPAASAAGIAFSADSGASSTDLVTNVAIQTISGTLTADLAAGEGVLVSQDNGHSWSYAAIDGARAWSLAGRTLAGSGTLVVQVTDAAGNTGPAVSRAYVLDTTAPATVAGAIGISADSGRAADDFVTNVAAQTVSATLSAALAAGESLLASADGGAHWTDVSSMVDGTSVSWTGATLAPGAGTLQFRVLDLAGNAGTITSRAYTLDTVAPAAQASILTFSADSGASSTDLITNTAAQTLAGTLDRATDAGDAVRVSLDNGAHWTWAEHVTGSTAWSLAGQVLSHSDTVRVQVVDAAGNGGPVLSKAYVLDTTAPSASVTSAVLGVGATVTTARSSETGALYLVEKSVDIASQADLDAALLAGTAIRADVAFAATDTTIGTAGLAAGSYRVVAVDQAGNVGTPSGGEVTLRAAPTTVVASAAFSNDSGASASDFVTRIAAQDISGTVSAPTVAGERVEVSLDGHVWQTAANVVGTTGWTLAGQLLSGSGTLHVRVSNELVSSQAFTQAYVLDTAAPAAPQAPVLAAASDSGAPGDGITNVDRPVLSGTAEALAKVTVYDTDGTTVIGVTHADALGAWQLTATQLARGAHTITVRQTDVAGNVSEAGAPLALTIEATTPVTPPTTPPQPPALVDGVAVQVTSVMLAGGVMGQAISVPIVTAGRNETSGQSGVADIPLATAGGTNLLLAQLEQGYGLSSSGASVGVAGGLEFLIASIKAATPNHAAADQGHLTGNGQDFIDGLAATGSLLVQTVKPVSAGTASGTLTLSGPDDAVAGVAGVALVIDAGGLGAGSTIALKQVDFAAVIGSANVVATGGGTVLSGDAAGQQFTVAARDAGKIFAGGGSDTLSITAPEPAVAGSAQAGASAMLQPSVTLLHGGQDGDVAVFAGARADYRVDQHNGYLMVTSKAAPDAPAMVVNVETLQFGDGAVTVQNSASMDILAGMYQTVLGRQADVYGIAFWTDGLQSGTSWGQTVLDFIESAESEASHGAFNGIADHDLAILYSALFDRAPDAQGLAFWMAALDSGVSLEQIAGEFVQSAEMVGHQRAALAWDFIV